jgi:ADP-ribose pyrophosphatase YjhB (NUDIX family)
MWKTISSKEIFSHPRLSLIEDEIILPSGAKTTYLRYKDDGSAAATIIAKNKDGQILLQTEYSYPPNKKLFQFPGGHVPAGEDIQVGANRELMEEAKLWAKRLEPLGSYLIENRRFNMRMYVFLATELEEKSLEGDPEEDIESFWFSEDEIATMIKTDKIENCHTLASWCLYKLKK